MCGICGVIQVGGEPRPVLAAEALDRMTDAMTHRGPDDRGTYMGDGVALGARRLSVVDVAGGHQPFANEDGSVWAVQNGELYNHAELRAAARGATATGWRAGATPRSCRTCTSATARDASGQLRGNVRDRDLGRRAGGGRCSPATGSASSRSTTRASATCWCSRSELKSMLASGLSSRELDYEAIDAYLDARLRPRAAHAARRRVEAPARAPARGRPDGVSIERYWELPAAGSDPRHDAGRRRRGSARAARRGGAAAADERRPARGDAERRPRLEPHRRADGAALDRAGARRSRSASARPARRTSSPTRAWSPRARHRPPRARALDRRPDGRPRGARRGRWTSRWPTSRRSASSRSRELASRHVTVALSGQGADELLGGYMKHQAASLLRRLAAHARAGAAGAERRLAPLARGRSAGRRARWRRRPGRAPARDELQAGRRPARASSSRGPLAALDGGAARRAVRRDPGRAWTTTPCRRRSTSTASSALVDDMLHYFDRASMATRSRCACRSSTTSSWSTAPASRPTTRCTG